MTARAMKTNYRTVVPAGSVNVVDLTAMDRATAGAVSVAIIATDI